jgi:methionine salvage enolase-phosphatase E1
MKVKKLLPGGLLTAAMRAAVKARQALPMPTLTKRMNIIRHPYKKEALEAGASPEVANAYVKAVARDDRITVYKRDLTDLLKNKNLKPQIKKNIENTVKKVDNYKEKNIDTIQALIDKDARKPTMQKSGGFINMTKDKKYWKGKL